MDHQELLKFIRHKCMRYAENGKLIALRSGEPSPVEFDLNTIVNNGQMLDIAGHLMLCNIPPDTNAICAVASLEGHSTLLYGNILTRSKALSGFLIVEFPAPQPQAMAIGRQGSVVALPRAGSTGVIMPSTMGKHGPIRGYKPNSTDKVVLVDTVVTTGASTLTAINLLKDEFRLRAGNISVVSLIDREQGGTENFAKRGIPYYSVFTLDEFPH